jgi:hypothetical protein
MKCTVILTVHSRIENSLIKLKLIYHNNSIPQYDNWKYCLHTVFIHIEKVFYTHQELTRYNIRFVLKLIIIERIWAKSWDDFSSRYSHLQNANVADASNKRNWLPGVKIPQVIFNLIYNLLHFASTCRLGNRNSYGHLLRIHYNTSSLISAEGSLLFLTMCYSAFEFPANSFIYWSPSLFCVGSCDVKLWRCSKEFTLEHYHTPGVYDSKYFVQRSANDVPRMAFKYISICSLLAYKHVFSCET